MKSSYVERATKFLDMIFPDIEEYMMSPEEVANIIECYNMAHHRCVRVCHGATRIALITSDYVIKWDYNKRGVSSWGGNRQEAEVYKIAEEAGYSYLFAELTSVWRNGILFNIMPRFNTGRHRRPISEKVSDKEWCWLNSHVWDIHEGNYTLIKGKPIIFDYACKRQPAIGGLYFYRYVNQNCRKI